MATLTIDSITYSNVDRTTATLTGKMTCLFQSEFNGATREYWLSDLSITSPAGASVTTTNGTMTTSGSYRIYPFTAKITGLTAGSEQKITLAADYEIWKYVKDSITHYWFNYNYNGGTLLEYDGTIKTDVGERYLRLQNNGYTMYPNKDSTGSSIYDTYGYNSTYEAYYYLWTYTEDASAWVDSSYPTATASKTVYTKPNAFYFGNGKTVSSGTKWAVSEGIQTILINIYNFNTEATKWKKWKNQLIQTACSAFSKGTLSATMLNNAYSYLGSSTRYSPGDKVSAAMFSGLENIMNA